MDFELQPLDVAWLRQTIDGADEKIPETAAMEAARIAWQQLAWQQRIRARRAERRANWSHAAAAAFALLAAIGWWL